MNDNNYKILSVYQLNNILCISDELCESIKIDHFNTEEYIIKLYKEQYIDNLIRLQVLPWNENINYWLNIPNPEILLKAITNYFVCDNDRSSFDVKTKIKDIDFSIE
jgi:hypothetical protein